MDPREEWALGFLDYIGAGATGSNDARLQWLIAWQTMEATWNRGNQNNPLDISGDWSVGGQGVSAYNGVVNTYQTAQEGYDALVQYLSNANDGIILSYLKNRSSTLQDMYDAVVHSNWNGDAGGNTGPGGQYAVANAIRENLGSAASEVSNTGGFQSGNTGVTPGIQSQQQQNAEGIMPYNGPDAYHGFDLAAIPAPDRARAEQTIQQYLASPSAQAEVEGEIQKLYGFTSWLFEIPSVKTILIVGTLEHWSNDAIFGAVQQTQWWQTHDANQRYWAEIQGSDPATAQEALNSARAAIQRTAATIGLPANYFSAGELNMMAEQIASNSIGSTGSIPDTGFTQDQITRMVASAYVYKKGQAVGGDIATLQDDYRKLAGQYMIPQSDQQIGVAAQNAIQGDYNQLQFVRGSESAYEDMLKQQAVAKYPYMASQIDAGITPYQWTDSYRQTAGQILEVNPYDVDMEGKFGFALNQTNDKGQKVPMSLADFSRELMGNPVYGYQYTTKAVNDAWTNASQILDALGAVPAPAGF